MNGRPDILLVEDDRNYAEMILMALGRRGWRGSGRIRARARCPSS